MSNQPFNGVRDWNEIFFTNRRSPILSRYGMVASSQPLASQIGQSILKQGGNAADACCAMNIALSVTEPMCTGMGGDCFALYYKNDEKKVYGLNGSGHTSHLLTYNNFIQKLHSRNIKLSDFKLTDALNVTVPGNTLGTLDLLNRFGTFSKEQIFIPSIKLAENGFPVGPITAHLWKYFKYLLDKNEFNSHELLNKNMETPKCGEIFENKYLANTLRKIMTYGKNGFYNSDITDKIVNLVNSKGGILTKTDFINHKSTFIEPICVNYKGIKIWEIPPNGQGIAALMALNMYKNIENNNNKIYSTNLDKYIDDLHIKIECMRLSYHYGKNIIYDGSNIYNKYLSNNFAKNAILNNNFNLNSVINNINDKPFESHGTVSFCAIDKWGNGCSMISSSYWGFGTGLIPNNCGFTLHNRGFGFNKNNKNHPNCIGANKRPFHTIIPGLATTNNNKLYCCFSVTGGYMQPQGHFQVISNMIDKGLNPQQALDAPRFRIVATKGHGIIFIDKKNSKVFVENQNNIDYIVKKLKDKGHNIQVMYGQERKKFGRGQIIYKDPNNGVLWGASDGRGDGCAIGIESIAKL